MDVFHVGDGWFFERLEDGAVKITHDPNEGRGGTVLDVKISADSWASVLAAVSAKGDVSEQFYAARSFHMGGSIEAMGEEGKEARHA